MKKSRVNKFWFCCAFTFILLNFSVVNMFAGINLSARYKLRMTFWEINKKNILLVDTRYFKQGSYNPIETAVSNGKLSTGPELEFFLANFFICGYYLQGKYDFDVGEIRRTDVGIDIGVEYVGNFGRAGVFIGRRKMNVSCLEWTSENIEELDIEDNVWGIVVRKSPDKTGFVGHFKALFNFTVFSGREEINIAELDFDFGHRFKAMPLAVSFGYGIWLYTIPTAERVGNYIEVQENLAHGPILKICCSF